MAKITTGCYSTLKSAPETTGAKVKSTVTYHESLKAIDGFFDAKRRVINTLNEATRAWLINRN
jgi:hypothetical protein